MCVFQSLSFYSPNNHSHFLNFVLSSDISNIFKQGYWRAQTSGTEYIEASHQETLISYTLGPTKLFMLLHYIVEKVLILEHWPSL